MKKFLNLAFLIVFSGFVFSESCLAQEEDKSSGFSITPFFKEINVDSSQEEVSFFLELENKTSQVAVLRLSVLDFGSLNESGGVAFLGSSNDVEKKYSLASWISLEKDAFVLNPKEKQSIKVSIINKDSLSPGGHYGSILAKIENENVSSEQEKVKVAFDPSFASLIFLRKIGGEIYELALKEQEFEKNLFFMPSNAKLRFQNSGNVHVIPRGIVKAVDPLKREVGKGIINSESAIVLPETFRILSFPIEKTALAFIPGKYEILTEYRFDGKDDFDSRKIEVYIFPPFSIFVILIILLLAGGTFFRKYKKNKNGRQ